MTPADHKGATANPKACCREHDPADHANTIREELSALHMRVWQGQSFESPALAALDALEAQVKRSWPVELVALEKRIVAAEGRYDRAAKDIGRLQAERDRLTELNRGLTRDFNAMLISNSRAEAERDRLDGLYEAQAKVSAELTAEVVRLRDALVRVNYEWEMSEVVNPDKLAAIARAALAGDNT